MSEPIKLVHQFLRCAHCKMVMPGLRYQCPYCNWPREHADETPPPTSGAYDPRTDEPPPLPPPVVVEPPPTLVPTVSGEGGPDPILVVPVPQTPRHMWKEPKEPSWDEIAGKPVQNKAAIAAMAPVARTIALAPEDAPPAPAEPAEPVVASNQAHHVGSPTNPLTAFEAPKRRSPRKKKS
ncbi:MAG: hypothetical protein ACHQ9S_19015 [Candidatus Binatia bacterium]